MGLFDDVSRFLETRLEEFLRNNPHLELQALEEQLREQEEDTRQLVASLQQQQKRLQDEILATAQEIKKWHSRVEKAKTSGRLDLAQAAQEQEAALLRQGNQLWGQMQGFKERIEQARELQKKIQTRRQEVHTKKVQTQATRSDHQAEQRWDTAGWNRSPGTDTTNMSADSLEEKFHRWEMDDELEKLKRQMGR